MFPEILEKHMGKIIGVLIGLLFGLLAANYGFFKALFVTICAAAGYYFGKRLDERINFRELIQKFFQR